MNIENIKTDSKIKQLVLVNDARFTASKVKILADFFSESVPNILDHKLLDKNLSEDETQLFRLKLEEFYQILTEIIES